MVQYICKRCNYNTVHRGTFKRHLLRKQKCKCIQENIKIEEIWVKYFEGDCKNIKKSSFNPHKSSFNPHKSSLKDKKMNRRECKYCKNIYSSYKNLWRHEKSYCKLKNEQIILRDDIKDNVKIVNNNTNSHNTTNNINNIVNINLRAYNDPNMEHINMKYLNNLFKRLNLKNKENGLFELIKDTQCNKNYKENINIVLPSLKNRKFIKVFNGSEWEMQLRKHIFDEIITKYFQFNENIIEEIKKNKSLENKFFYLFFTSNKIDFKFDEKYNDDGYKKVYKDLCDKLEVEFYNNKDSSE